jgi:hypothetical protein
VLLRGCNSKSLSRIHQCCVWSKNYRCQVQRNRLIGWKRSSLIIMHHKFMKFRRISNRNAIVWQWRLCYCLKVNNDQLCHMSMMRRSQLSSSIEYIEPSLLRRQFIYFHIRNTFTHGHDTSVNRVTAHPKIMMIVSDSSGHWANCVLQNDLV